MSSSESSFPYAVASTSSADNSHDESHGIHNRDLSLHRPSSDEDDPLKFFRLENPIPKNIQDSDEYKSSDKEDGKPENEVKIFSFGDEIQMLPDSCFDDQLYLSNPLDKFIELVGFARKNPEGFDIRDEKLNLLTSEEESRHENGDTQKSDSGESDRTISDSKNNNKKQFDEKGVKVDDVKDVDFVSTLDEFLFNKDENNVINDEFKALFEVGEQNLGNNVQEFDGENGLLQCEKKNQKVITIRNSTSSSQAITISDESDREFLNLIEQSFNHVDEPIGGEQLPVQLKNKRLLSETIQEIFDSSDSELHNNGSNPKEEVFHKQFKRIKKKKSFSSAKKNKIKELQGKKNVETGSSTSWKETSEDETSLQISDDEQWEDIEEQAEPKAGPSNPKQPCMNPEFVSCHMKKKLTRNVSTDGSSNSGSIEAFLPECIGQWAWKDAAYKESRNKLFYKAIKRKDECISLGDVAVFISTGRQDYPLIGKIKKMWQDPDEGMVVSCCWYYHEEETKGLNKRLLHRGGLFLSEHQDDNDVQTISHRCHVMTLKKFLTKKFEPDETVFYYHAGTYNFRTERSTLKSNIPIASEIPKNRKSND